MEAPESLTPDAVAALQAAVEELRRRNSELIEAVDARNVFIAVAAHELRNPMTPMLGQVEFLLDGVRRGRYSTEQVEQRLERLGQAMGHYLRRATSLLDVSRITSGKLVLRPTACDLSALIQETVDAFTPAARHAGIPIGITAPPSLPGTWDRLAMEQIIDNLISNAVKYGDGRPIAVYADALDDHVRLRVRDHGPGISMENRTRIFGRFERAVTADARHTGFGIGLWLVGQLVEAMRGEIKVNDAEGGGSVFDLILPRHGQ